MVNLATTIDKDTFIISDTHLGHFRVLAFEPIRVEYLADYNTEVIAECQELLGLLETVPQDEQRNHERIIELSKFLIPHHDKMIVEKWNAVVTPDSTVLHLGDFAFRGIEEWTKKLNGNKILLRGNHDLKSARTYTDAGWKDVIENIKIIVGNNTFDLSPRIDKYWNGLFTAIETNNDITSILFSHYPVFNNNEWDVKKYGKITDLLEEIYEDIDCDINIAGHTHTKNSDFENAINVSLEHCTNLSPMKLGYLISNFNIEKGSL